MNQIMPVGDGVLIAIEKKVDIGLFRVLQATWEARFPTVPCLIVSEAQIVQMPNDAGILFEFTGHDISPTFIAEFQRWWEEVNGAEQVSGSRDKGRATPADD
jgi:hypothetical protein